MSMSEQTVLISSTTRATIKEKGLSRTKHKKFFSFRFVKVAQILEWFHYININQHTNHDWSFGNLSLIML